MHTAVGNLEWARYLHLSRRGTPGRPVFAGRIARRLRRRPHPIRHHSGDGVRSAFPRPGRPVHRRPERAGLRLVSGRGVQTVGPPSAAPLMTPEERAIELCAAEIDRWHGDDSSLLQVAVVPRFTLSMSTRTLAALGEAVRRRPRARVFMPRTSTRTIGPGTGEIDAVKSLFSVNSYLDTYDGGPARSAVGGSSLLGRRTIMARRAPHRHRTGPDGRDRHLDRALSRVSQQFLGSGTMPWRRTVAARGERGRRYRCGRRGRMADPAGARLRIPRCTCPNGDDAVALHPAELLFTGTLAGARALDAESRSGTSTPARRPTSWWWTPPAGEPLELLLSNGIRAEDDEMARDQLLFALLLGCRSRPSPEVYVRGARVVVPPS